MILRDRNHPSVVIWSLGDEIVEDGSYAQRGAQMAALLRSLDRTRPLTLGGGSTSGASDRRAATRRSGPSPLRSDFAQ
jgi:beta-galactosidase